MTETTPKLFRGGFKTLFWSRDCSTTQLVDSKGGWTTSIVVGGGSTPTNSKWGWQKSSPKDLRVVERPLFCQGMAWPPLLGNQGCGDCGLNHLIWSIKGWSNCPHGHEGGSITPKWQMEVIDLPPNYLEGQWPI